MNNNKPKAADRKLASEDHPRPLTPLQRAVTTLMAESAAVEVLPHEMALATGVKSSELDTALF